MRLLIPGALAASLLVVSGTGHVCRAASPAPALADRGRAKPVAQQPSLATTRARVEAIASYELLARLDTDAHVVHGSGKIRWKNPSRVPAGAICLHLYLNAFKNDKSLFLRSPFGAGRSGDKATDHGYVEVKSLTLEGSKAGNLWPQAEWQAKNDTTDVRIPLPEPVAPDQTVTFDVSFESKLPRIVERSGYAGSYHFVAQWFPKIAKREPDGSWAHFAYHPQSEFYSDFGDYQVTIEVPDGFVVGATGKLVRRETRPGIQRLVYQQDSVHDFAFTAWDQFVVTRASIDGIDVELLHPEGYEHAAEITQSALELALPHFRKRYGRYPYSTLTVVHPPEQGENSGGMEYPTLITTGVPWFAPYIGVRALEAVTVHELGHQWFYGLLASNEHAWPFLDEGINSYAEGEALDAFYGTGSLVHDYFFEISMPSLQRSQATSSGEDEIVGQAASEFTSFRSLGAHVYSRTATILDCAARVYGQQKLRSALARYTHEQRFRHPTPTDFFAALRAELGEQATRNLHRAVFERGRVDYLVKTLQSVQEGESGWGDESDSGERQAPPGDAPWLSRVVVVRRGQLEFPVSVRLLFEDGSQSGLRWSGRGETHAFTHRGPSRLVAAAIDPEHRVSLDDDLLNNARRDEALGVPRVWERAVYYLGVLFAFLAP